MNGIGKMRGYFTQKELKEFAAETEKELIHGCGVHNRRKIYEALLYVQVSQLALDRAWESK